MFKSRAEHAFGKFTFGQFSWVIILQNPNLDIFPKNQDDDEAESAPKDLISSNFLPFNRIRLKQLKIIQDPCKNGIGSVSEIDLLTPERLKVRPCSACNMK